MQNPEIMFTNHELKIHSNTSHEAVLLQTNPWDELLSEPFSRQDIRSLSPATNIYEYENQFIIIMAIPGLEKKDFVIHVKKNRITVQVQKDAPLVQKKSRPLLLEFNFHTLYRTFLLPDGLQTDNITASYAEGILQLIVPKFETGTHFPVQEIPVR
jgi:HSP20 family protein